MHLEHICLLCLENEHNICLIFFLIIILCIILLSCVFGDFFQWYIILYYLFYAFCWLSWYSKTIYFIWFITLFDLLQGLQISFQYGWRRAGHSRCTTRTVHGFLYFYILQCLKVKSPEIQNCLLPLTYEPEHKALAGVMHTNGLQ